MENQENQVQEKVKRGVRVDISGRDGVLLKALREGKKTMKQLVEITNQKSTWVYSRLRALQSDGYVGVIESETFYEGNEKIDSLLNPPAPQVN
jgi:predicted type IV restriction endonuclease